MALDLAEIFKPVLVDRLIFRVLNRKMIQRKDFERDLNYVVLKEEAKKRFVKEYQGMLKETIAHRSLKKKVSYRRLIRLEAYKLVSHVLDIDGYQPFKF